jgi:hypothetical protein
MHPRVFSGDCCCGVGELTLEEAPPSVRNTETRKHQNTYQIRKQQQVENKKTLEYFLTATMLNLQNGDTRLLLASAVATSLSAKDVSDDGTPH